MLKVVPTSVKHCCRMIECLICENVNDMADAIRFCTSVQNDFVTYGDFMFWRGRVLLYSG